MVTAPRVFFVNRFYAPEQPATAQLLTDLAEGLVRSGIPVTVCARRLPRTTSPEEGRNGVELRGIRTSAWGRRSLAGRAFDFLTFIMGARQQLREHLRPRDVVVAMTDPPMLGTALSTCVQKKSAHLVHWVQDIFPEVASAVSGTNLAQVLRRPRDRAWRLAEHCVVPGEDMAKFLRARGVSSNRITIAPNWAPIGLAPVADLSWRQCHRLSGRFIVMYSGNLGRVHDFSAIIPLARALGHDSGVSFVFVGDGAQRADLESRVREQQLPQIVFLPAQPREHLGAVLSSGHVHLVTLRKGCEDLVFPSKLYGIAAVGRPALVIGPPHNEPSRLVNQHGFGAAFCPEEIPAIADFIRRLKDDPAQADALGQAALRFSHEHGQFAHALATWRGVLGKLMPLAGIPASTTESRSAP